MASAPSRKPDLRVLLLGGVLATIAVIDVLLGSRAVAGALYAIVPVAAAALLSLRGTALLAVLAVALAAVSGVWNLNLGTTDWWIRLLLCGLLGLLAMFVAAMRVRRERALQAMTLVAEAAQHAVLRTLPTQLRDYRFAARYLSATDAAVVGGDLYEVVDSPFGVRCVVGDVRGKGLEAVQLSATVMAAFRWAAVTESSLESVARNLDTVVTTIAGDEDFVTAILAEFHEETVSVVNCGHHPPVVIQADRVHLLDTGEPALPLGLGSAPRTVTGKWPNRCRLLLYTDGLAESRDRQGRFFPLLAAAERLRDGSLDEALDRLLGAVESHSGQQRNDDLALVLAEHHSGRPTTA